MNILNQLNPLDPERVAYITQAFNEAGIEITPNETKTIEIGKVFNVSGNNNALELQLVPGNYGRHISAWYNLPNGSGGGTPNVWCKSLENDEEQYDDNKVAHLVDMMQRELKMI